MGGNLLRLRRADNDDIEELSEPMATINSENFRNFPQIPRAEAKMLWHSDFWDGPISGMLSYQGQSHWFEMIEENEDSRGTWCRRYAILKLTADQREDERYWHELFRANVGTHTDYDENEVCHAGELRPKELHKNFYDKYKDRRHPDYLKNPVLGWFEI